MPPDHPTDPTPATPDEAVEPNGGPIEAFALALDIDSWAEAVDLSERSVPNLRSIGWELRRFDDGMDWRSAYLHLLESWAAVCEMTGIESDSSPEEVVEALSRQQALPLPSERGGQGDTVAARAEDVARRYAARNWDAMSPVMQEHFLDVARRLLGMDGDK